MDVGARIADIHNPNKTTRPIPKPSVRERRFESCASNSGNPTNQRQRKIRIGAALDIGRIASALRIHCGGANYVHRSTPEPGGGSSRRIMIATASPSLSACVRLLCRPGRRLRLCSYPCTTPLRCGGVSGQLRSSRSLGPVLRVCFSCRVFPPSIPSPGEGLIWRTPGASGLCVCLRLPIYLGHMTRIRKGERVGTP